MAVTMKLEISWWKNGNTPGRKAVWHHRYGHRCPRVAQESAMQGLVCLGWLSMRKNIPDKRLARVKALCNCHRRKKDPNASVLHTRQRPTLILTLPKPHTLRRWMIATLSITVLATMFRGILMLLLHACRKGVCQIQANSARDNQENPPARRISLKTSKIRLTP
jgi:hypothetical protein